jgi:hypothetical protein
MDQQPNLKVEIDKEKLAELLNAMYAEQKKQSGYLRSISLAAGVFILIAVFSFLFGSCSAFSYF